MPSQFEVKIAKTLAEAWLVEVPAGDVESMLCLLS
jgi:hypothetical protein